MAQGRPGAGASAIERTGWALFGSWRRLQLGMWIARIPGVNQPRTFTIAEYWDYLRSRELPGWGQPVRSDLRRFVELEMLQDRPEMTAKRVCQHWTRLDSPLERVHHGESGVGSAPGMGGTQPEAYRQRSFTTPRGVTS